MIEMSAVFLYQEQGGEVVVVPATVSPVVFSEELVNSPVRNLDHRVHSSGTCNLTRSSTTPALNVAGVSSTGKKLSFSIGKK